MLYMYAAQSETMFFALRCICFYCSTGKASQTANATSNGDDASRVIYSIGLCKFAKIINISSGRRPIPRLS